jgi:hypothetical protein
MIKDSDASSWDTYILVDGSEASIIFDRNDKSPTLSMN